MPSDEFLQFSFFTPTQNGTSGLLAFPGFQCSFSRLIMRAHFNGFSRSETGNGA